LSGFLETTKSISFDQVLERLAYWKPSSVGPIFNQEAMNFARLLEIEGKQRVTFIL